MVTYGYLFRYLDVQEGSNAQIVSLSIHDYSKKKKLHVAHVLDG